MSQLFNHSDIKCHEKCTLLATRCHEKCILTVIRCHNFFSKFTSYAWAFTLLPKKMSENFFRSYDEWCHNFSLTLFFLCMSFLWAQRRYSELLYWFVTQSVRTNFLLHWWKMFSGFGSRTFFRTSITHKITIPDLLRKCKGDTLPPLSLPYNKSTIFSLSFLCPHKIVTQKDHWLVKNVCITTNGFSLRYFFYGRGYALAEVSGKS